VQVRWRQPDAGSPELGRCCGRSAPFAGRPHPLLRGDAGGRQPRVARRGIIEPVIFAAATVFLALAKPKSAPGPSEKLLARAEQARADVKLAREKLDEASPEDAPALRAKLQEALAVLATVEEELREAQADQANYPVPGYLSNVYGKGKVMIAVTGASGVGKSSWINAIRRMRASDAGAAKTGITETTMEPEMYSFPVRGGFFRRIANRVLRRGRSVGRSFLAKPKAEDSDGNPVQVGDRVLLRSVGKGLNGQVGLIISEHNPAAVQSWDVRLDDGQEITATRDQLSGVLSECVIWDLPGVGTPNYPQAAYIAKMGIRYFDVVILLTATRFTEAELMLVEELKRFKVPFFMVRNKTDVDVQSEVDREEEMTDEDLNDERIEEVKLETVTTIKEYFRDEYNLPKVYCIATKRKTLDQYDFKELERDVEAAVKTQRSADAEKKSPVDPEEASPADPEEASPADPEEASPADPEEASPADPEKASPVDPEKASSVDPEKESAV